jgi:hypothetical protein
MVGRPRICRPTTGEASPRWPGAFTIAAPGDNFQAGNRQLTGNFDR